MAWLSQGFGLPEEDYTIMVARCTEMQLLRRATDAERILALNDMDELKMVAKDSGIKTGGTKIEFAERLVAELGASDLDGVLWSADPATVVTADGAKVVSELGKWTKHFEADNRDLRRAEGIADKRHKLMGSTDSQSG
ncbi:MAG: hypothetical protein ACKVS8_14655 [Phycisphaerales bacterium]